MSRRDPGLGFVLWFAFCAVFAVVWLGVLAWAVIHVVSWLGDEMTTRPPVRWATYQGDARSILADRPQTPSLNGEALYPVTADFDAETNLTRVGFSYIAPEDAA